MFALLQCLLAYRAMFVRRVARMGQHAWLLLATVLTELLIIFKWSRGQFSEPFPAFVKIGSAAGASILVAYPLFKVGVHPFYRFRNDCLF